MRLEPLQDRVLIRRDAKEAMFHGVIHLPENRTEKPQLGTVVAVGGGKVLEDGTSVPPLLQVGDRIMFGKYSGTDLRLGEEELIIMREADILGIVHEGESQT